LYQAIKKDIIKSYKIGDKLFSLRKMAQTYNISKTTVLNAYSQLVIEGYIDSKDKSAYFVIENNYKDLVKEAKNEKKKNDVIDKEYDYNFYPARQEKDSFPIKLWKRLSTKSLHLDLDYCANANAQGELTLRQEICKYLIRSRQVSCDVSQIIVCHGFTDSMLLLSRILNKTHKMLAIESPGYKLARDIFCEQNYSLDEIPVNEQGIELDALERSKTKLLYITPSHQFPTGVSMPIKNRLRVLSWAKKNKALIIEDDYDSELSYYNRPIPSLQGLDRHNSVIYLGTFSKSLASSLRVSYMVLPKYLLKAYEKLSDSKDARVSLMLQNTLFLFMKEGHWDKHQRKVRTLNKRKHALMKSLLLKKLKNTLEIQSEGIGLSLLISCKEKMHYKLLENMALENKIKIYFVHEVSFGKYDAIRMGFGSLKIEEIPEAIERFSKLWFHCIEKSKTCSLP